VGWFAADGCGKKIVEQFSSTAQRLKGNRPLRAPSDWGQSLYDRLSLKQITHAAMVDAHRGEIF
ncbi:MAG: hypothetical protein ACKO81_00510, partial [Planctomycetota bacterium]